MTSVPDYISPILSYRVWQWDVAGLRSLNGELWHPGIPLEAKCRLCEFALCRNRNGAVRSLHNAPHMKCTCGIYASKNLEHLREYGYERSRIHGQVSLWGTMVEHQHGWRAQYGYPKRFFLPPEILPLTLTEIQARLQALIRYRCDIFIFHKGTGILFWKKDSGFAQAGFDYLTHRARQWYARHKQKSAIKQGDRVAVVGRGTAVVEELDSTWIHTLLGNNRRVRIARKHLSWNRQNVRWEASTLMHDEENERTKELSVRGKAQK